MKIKLLNFKIGEEDYQEIVGIESDLRIKIKNDSYYLVNIGDHQDLSLRNVNPLFSIYDNENILKKNELEDKSQWDEYDHFVANEEVRFAFIENNELVISKNYYPNHILFFKGMGIFEKDESFFIINKNEEIVAGPFDDPYLSSYNPLITSEEFIRFFRQTDELSLDPYENGNFGYGISFEKINNLYDGISESMNKELGLLFYTGEYYLKIEEQLGLNIPDGDFDYRLFASPTLKLSGYSFKNVGSNFESIFDYEDHGLAIVNFNNRHYFINRYLFFIGPEEGFEEFTTSCPAGEKLFMPNWLQFTRHEKDVAQISINNDEGGLIEFNGNFIEEFLLYPQLFFKYNHIKIFIMDLFNASEITNNELLEREYISWDKIILEDKIIRTNIKSPEIDTNENWVENYIFSDDFKYDILSHLPFILPEELKHNKELLKNLIKEHNKAFGIIHSSFKRIVVEE